MKTGISIRNILLVLTGLLMFVGETLGQVTDITIKTQPSKLAYVHGEALDLNGLVATLTDNGSPVDVPFADFWKYGIATNPVNGTTLSYSTHNGTPIVVLCNGYTANTTNLTVNAPTYGIELSLTGTHTFFPAIVGYGAQIPLTVIVRNMRNQPTGALTVAFSALSVNPGSFSLSTTNISSISVGGDNSFTVVPRNGLAVGTHTAIVTVSGNNGITANFNVSFTVSTAGISLSPTSHTFPPATLGYGTLNPLSVTVNNLLTQPTGQLTISTSSSNFILSGTSITAPGIASGSNTTFTVRPDNGLPVGIHTATITVSGGNGISASLNVSFTVNPAPTYGISLNQSGTYNFPSTTALTVTVENVGNQATGALTVALSGTNAGSFALSPASANIVNIANISVGGSANFTVVPNPGLPTGTYTATVTVSGNSNITQRTFNVSYTVMPAPTYGISLSQSGTYDFGAVSSGYSAQTPLSVTVNNVGNQTTGALTIALSGANPGSFALSPTSANIANINVGGSANFTVVPNPGLSNGTYTATVTVSGNSNITQRTFNVIFTVTATPNFGISLSPSGTYSFPPVDFNYSALTPLNVTVRNIGNQATGALTVAFSALSVNPGSFSLSLAPIPSIAVGGAVTLSVTPISGLLPGTYTATVEVGNSNITPLSFSVSITVNRAPVNPPNVATGLVYTGGQLTGVAGISGNAGYTVATGTGTAINAGNYEATVTLNSPDNYRWSDNGTTERKVPWSIAKANPVITFNSLSSINHPLTGARPTYGDDPFNIGTYASSIPVLPVSFRLAPANPTPLAVSVTSAGSVTINYAGIATIEAYVAATDNYNGASQNQDLLINKAPLHIIPINETRRVGEENPEFTATFQGWKKNDDESLINDNNPKLLFSTTANIESAAGKYPIIVSVTSGSLVNYIFNALEGTLTVTDKPTLWVTVNTSRFYGDDNPDPETLTFVYTGFVDGETYDMYKENIMDPVVTYSVNATPEAEPRRYAITLTEAYDKTGKYFIQQGTSPPSRLTIEKAPIRVWAPEITQYEDDPIKESYDFKYSLEDFKLGQDTSVILKLNRPKAVLDRNSVIERPYGPWNIIFEGGNTDPHYRFDHNNGRVFIMPREYRITYGDTRIDSVATGINYRAEHPDIIGLIIGDGILTGKAKKSGTTRIIVEVSPPMYIPVTVERRPLYVWVNDTTRIAGEINPVFKIFIEGFAPGDGPSVIYPSLEVLCTAQKNSPPDKYLITFNPYSRAENYNILFNTMPGSTKEKESFLKVVKGETLSITAFTPNGDGINDTFPGIENYGVKIYNRLGTLIYEGDDGWDGTHMKTGNIVDPGLYFYIATSPPDSNDNDRRKVYKGTVEVIRTK